MSSNEKKVIKGIVKTVVPLTEKQFDKLTEKLMNKYNQKVELKQEIDKDIIGGLFIQIENEFIDATVNSQYEEMKDIMLNKK
ncbi:MAG: F0F1 ATP synthase subunit delta [Sarcina sp.]